MSLELDLVSKKANKSAYLAAGSRKSSANYAQLQQCKNYHLQQQYGKIPKINGQLSLKSFLNNTTQNLNDTKLESEIEQPQLTISDMKRTKVNSRNISSKKGISDIKNKYFEQLQQSHEKMVSQYSNSQEISKKQISELEKRIEGLLKENHKLIKINGEKSQKIDQLESNIELLKNKKQVENLKLIQECGHAEQIQELQNIIGKFEENHQENSRKQLQIIQEKDFKIEQLSRFQSENLILAEKLKTFDEISRINCDLENTIRRMRSQLSDVTKQIQDLREEKVGSQKGLSSFEQIVSELEKKQLQKLDQIQSLKSEKQKLEIVVSEQQNAIFNLENKIQNQSLDQDLFKLYNSSNSNCQQTMNDFEKQIEKLKKQIEDDKQTTFEKDQKIIQLNERVTQVQDRDKELERIFEYVNDLNKTNFSYVHVENDKVDKHLAEIIQRSEKSKMLFIRESEGVYTYCKKKVFMKNEHDRLIIRVGGGYMSLEEFIDTFNPFQQWKPKYMRNESAPKLNKSGSNQQMRSPKSRQNKSQLSQIKKNDSISTFSNITNLANLNFNSPAERRSKKARNCSSRQKAGEQVEYDHQDAKTFLEQLSKENN